MYGQASATQPRRLGAVLAGATIGTGTTTIVSAAANTTGLIIRSMVISPAATALVAFSSGGAQIFASPTYASWPGAEIIIPAGKDFSVYNTAGSSNYGCSYDVLT